MGRGLILHVYTKCHIIIYNYVIFLPQFSEFNILLLSESRVIINNLELLRLALNTNQSLNELVCDIAWLHVTNHLCHGSRS
jgi:hypothetical protein